MKVSELVSYLQSLDQNKNIFLVYDRMEYQPCDVDILTQDDIDSFKLPDYLKDDPEDDLPKVGDYFFDAY